jgi:hypothetical protein
MSLVHCVWCDGTAVDEEGNRCLACDGSTKVPWSFVVTMDAIDRYPASVQLEQGAEFVREATEAIR